MRLAQESLGLWRELEGETGETVLELNGLVEVVQTLEESTAHTLERCGVAWERLERAEAERALPDPRSRGLVRRRPARGRDRPRGQGARRLRAASLDVREDARVRPDELDADAVVVTAGPWVNELLDEPLPVKVTRETLAYFRPEDGRPIPSVVSFKPGRHTHEMYSLARPGVRAEGRRAPRRARSRRERPGRARARADRADRGAGRTRPTGWPTPSRSPPRPACTRRPRTRASSSNAAAASSSARRARATASSSRRRSASGSPASRTGRPTILRACPRTRSEARSRASGTSSSATTGRC